MSGYVADRRRQAYERIAWAAGAGGWRSRSSMRSRCRQARAVLDAGCGTGALSEAHRRARRRRAHHRRRHQRGLPGRRARPRAGRRLPHRRHRARCPMPDGAFDARAVAAGAAIRARPRGRGGGTGARDASPAAWSRPRCGTSPAASPSCAPSPTPSPRREPDGEAFRARYWGDAVGSPGRLARAVAAAGLRDVAERDIMIRQDFADFRRLVGPLADRAGHRRRLRGRPAAASACRAWKRWRAAPTWRGRAGRAAVLRGGGAAGDRATATGA